MKPTRQVPILLAALPFLLTALACGSSTEGDQLVRTLVVSTSESEAQGTSADQPTQVSKTDTPSTTKTAEIEGLLTEGTHLVGTDLQPGIYVGLAGEDILESCYWARLSNLTGSDDILANDNALGLFYVEVLPEDKAVETACELLPIEQVPARIELLTSLSPGTYLIGRDIAPGTYQGQAGTDILESCYWARLSNVNGDDNILANDNATGQYYVEVVATDFALQTGCALERVE